jgi:hypothetical protein
MRSRIWICFDLGLRGDFEGMYQFLDTHQAKECGDSAATFFLEHEGDVLRTLKRLIKDAVTIDKRTRVYVIYPFEDQMKGRFIFGRRKSPPWTGHAVTGEDEEDESGE